MLLGIPPWRTGDLPPQCPPRQRPRSSRTSRPWVLGFFYKLGIHQKLHFYSIFFNPKMYFLDSSSYLFILILWLKKIWSHLHSIHCIFIVFSMESHKNKAKSNFHGISFSDDFQWFMWFVQNSFFFKRLYINPRFSSWNPHRKSKHGCLNLSTCRSRSIIHDEFAIFHGDPLVMTNSLLLKPWPNRNSWWIPTQNGDVLQLS